MQKEAPALNIILLTSIVLNVILSAGIYYFYSYNVKEHTPIVDTSKSEKELPLQKYSYKNLKAATFSSEPVTFGKIVDEEDEYVTRYFYYKSDGKNMSGIAHFPKGEGNYPVVVMLRGYVDESIYEPGIGSNPAAQYFASNGYITLAPDYFGYAESDAPSAEAFADRLETYPAILQLLANIDDLDLSLKSSLIKSTVQKNNVGIWAHSNGGQIALSVLETSLKAYPTVLWAPVSKSFPYSVLYFTDEFEDNGRYLRKLIADFEDDYDIESFSLTNYFDEINSPIQLHQGGADDAVPLKWSNQLYDELTDLDVDIEYYTYPEADHNMRPDWDTAAERSLEFLDSHLKK